MAAATDATATATTAPQRLHVERVFCMLHALLSRSASLSAWCLAWMHRVALRWCALSEGARRVRDEAWRALQKAERRTADVTATLSMDAKAYVVPTAARSARARARRMRWCSSNSWRRASGIVGRARCVGCRRRGSRTGTCARTPFQVDMRVCQDCHAFFEKASNLYTEHTIELADPKAVHIFQRGVCKLCSPDPSTTIM